jgi:hypothetical protein
MTNNKKQTAVERFNEEINKLNVGTDARVFIAKLFEQALEMEKEQIVEAYKEGYSDGDFYEDERLDKELAEQYYKETYED